MTTRREVMAGGVGGVLAAGIGALGAPESTFAAVPLPVNSVRDFGAVGDGVADDTAAIRAAQLSIPGQIGIIAFPPGTYRVTESLVLRRRQAFVGAGAGAFGSSEVGVSTILSSFDGPALVIPDFANGWALERLTLLGDRGLANQDLLVLGRTFGGLVRGVTVGHAGRDGAVLNGTLNVHFDQLYVHGSKRDNLRATGLANANKFTKCLFRTASQWGVHWSGGTDCHFDNCTIEANNQDDAGYGGILIDAPGGPLPIYVAVTLTSCHFEANAGAALQSGVPIQLNSGAVAVTETGGVYSETNPLAINVGRLTSVGVMTNLHPHAIVKDAANAMFVHPQQIGGGVFSVTDPAHRTTVLGDAPGPARAAQFRAAFANRWTGYGGGWAPPTLSKDPAGRVHLEGRVAKIGGGKPAVGEQILRLPSGYRPSGRLEFIAGMGESNGVGRVRIEPDGWVTWRSGPKGITDVNLGGLSFRAQGGG
jgi:hypothetical protein